MSTEIKSILHKAALQWAAQGFYVFPCVKGRKEPAVGDWENWATIDPAKIDAHWSTYPDNNLGIALGPSGSTVIDVDPPLGEASLAALTAHEGVLPDTFITRTPRGGRHLWFDGNGPTSVGTDKRGLGPKIDTRGVGGYVLVPPSIIAPGEYSNNKEGGSYANENSEDFAPLPAWVTTRVKAKHERHVAADVEDDLPANVERAITFLRGQPPIREGAGADGTTYIIACTLRDFRLTPETCVKLMLEHLDIQPRDDRLQAFFTRKVRNAFEYGQNEAGAFAVESPADAFKDFIATADIEPTSSDKPVENPFHFRDEAEQDTAKETEWLVPGMIPANSIGFMYGDSDSFKTFLALDLCLGLGAQIETFGHVSTEPIETAYIAGEGPREIERKRRPAWKQARMCDKPVPFYTVDTMPLANDNDTVTAFLDTAKQEGRKPKLVVIDTLFWFAGGLDMNNGKDVGIAMAQARKIRNALGCAVMFINHIGKKEELGMAGSRHQFGAADFVLMVKRHPNTYAVRVEVKKQKDGERRSEPWLFEGRKIGPSLAFFPTDASTYNSIVQEEHVTSKKNIAAALREMGAVGEDAAVTVYALAAQLAASHDTEAGIVEKALKKGAKGPPLNAYCDAAGFKWFIPAAS